MRLSRFAYAAIVASCLTGTGLADWPQYRGPNGDGKIAESLATPSGVELNVEWSAKTPLGFSSFAVADGSAFTIVVKDNSETVVSLDAKNGNEQWEYRMGTNDYGHGGGDAGAPGNRGGDGPRSTPTISDGKVYIYDSHLVLHCLDAQSGDLQWKHDIVAEYAGKNIKWLNATSPIVDGDRVFVSGGGEGQSFLAFDKTNGELIWKTGSETITHATPVLATIEGKKQLINFVQSGLVSLDAETGEELWRTIFRFSVSTAASPVVNGSNVYCSAGYSVGAGYFKVVNNSAVEDIWVQENKLMNHWSTPVVHNGHLYGIFEFKKYGRAPLKCVDLKTGEIVWSESGFGPGNCILVGEKLVVLSDAGEVAIVNATTDGYQELARKDVLDGKCWSTPAYSDGRIFVRSTEEAACISLQ
ncbi:outer membrane protein assembly factor BamB family protein [Roseiconus lacunae]|uniref:outer membrane protein assembly factor BamB family protein n=1 Tax=Roseiconus lacunae TaxID=2605694 RepID=UPI001E4FC3CD|nr:PQQ-binding-like beta-propeller repeat protein [Roseiconus lacunae]MCD0459786.1 PQQ-binding-like beta-propeller repeat protein [Roseiconus lacunae]